MGTPATMELKQLRNRAHEEFDTLWSGEEAIMSRTGAYQWLEDVMDLPPDQAHIAHFNEEQCEKLIIIVKEKRINRESNSY